MIIGICSGYFNPINGAGHIDYLIKAKDYCDKLIVILNNDEQVKLKGSIPFQDEKTREIILNCLNMIDEVWLSESKTLDVASDIERIYKQETIFRPYNKFIFFNGGDRSNKQNSAEEAFCKDNGIRIETGVGGIEKQSSSSSLIENAAKEWIKKNWVEANELAFKAELRYMSGN